MGHYEVLSSVVMLWMVLSQRGGTDAQTYQWSCSALDINNSRYTLPGFPSAVEELDTPHLLTSGLQMYIYAIPPDPPLNCSGTVSGFGYCYRQRGNSTSAFTLLTMQQAGTSFTITNSIKVRTTQRSQCIGEYCCDSFQLRTEDLFTLPMADFAFGIVPLLAPLGFNPESFPQYRVEHYRADVQGLTLETRDMVEGGSLLTDRTLRLFQFFIDVPPTTASPTTSDDSTTATPTTAPLTTAPPTTAPPPTAPLTTAFSPTAPLTTAPPPTAPPTTAPPTTAPPTTSEGNTTTPNTTSPPTTTTEGTDAEEPYQWSCSALDTVKNRYYLPDVPYTLDDAHGFFANISDDLVQSSANTLYIYPLPSSLNCNGTVSELGYCYLVNATQLGTQLSIFRFYVLRESGPVFEETNSRASVLTTPSAENCTASSVGHICCDSFKLRRMNQFRLPASNFTFGIMQSPFASLLAFNQSLYPQYLVQHYREVQPSFPIKFGFLMEDRALQLFQFFITPDEDATTEPNVATEATETTEVTSDAEVTATEVTTDAEATTTEVATDAVVTTTEVTTDAEVTTVITTGAEVTTTAITTDAEVTTTDVTTDATDATDVATNVAEATSSAAEVTPTESMETQLYEWSCSTLDQNNNQYFLPGLAEGGDNPDAFIARNRINFLWSEVQMYIYPLPASLNCSGEVSGVEYCYFNTERERDPLVFTLLTLEQNGRNFIITDMIDIWSTPDQEMCTGQFCCDSTILNPEDKFRIPAPNFSFAIVPADGDASLLGYNGISYPQYLVRHYTRSVVRSASGQFNVGSAEQSDEALRVFRFIIKDEATTLTEANQTSRRPTTQGSTSNIDGRTTEAQGAVGGSGGATIAVAGGVVGGIVVATLVLVVVLALVIVMRRKRRESWKPPAGSDISYPNAIYGEDEPYNVLQRPSAEVPQKDHGPNTYSHLQEPATILPNDAYEEIPQDQANEYSYAQFGEKGLKINNTYEAIPPSSKKQSETYETIPSSHTPVEKKSETYEAIAPPHPPVEKQSEPRKELTPPPALVERDSETKTVIPPYATVNKKPKTPEYAKVDKKRSKEPSTPEPEKIYQVPETDENALYAQLGEIFTNSVTRDTVSLGDLMGSGQFGTVYRGVWQSDIRGEVKVAVKTLKEGSKEEDRVKFLQEAAIMGQFKHHNVVEMYGVVSVGEPVLLVLEMLSKGDLRGHLLRLRSNEEGNVNTDDHTLIKYCQDIAAGLAYLSGKAFVHRDLAARNVLVSEDDTCKIADFGMSRDLMDESYYVSHGGKIPVKWTAPEALNYKKYSTASDVWSYGIVMYEIWSVGHKPFEDFGNNKVLKLVETGYRLPPPPGCPRAIYNVMVSCWHPKTSMRPDFAAICHQLSPADAELLKWTEADKSTHPQVVVLGADLIHSKELFKDLQTMYITNGNM